MIILVILKHFNYLISWSCFIGRKRRFVDLNALFKFVGIKIFYLLQKHSICKYCISYIIFRPPSTLLVVLLTKFTVFTLQLIRFLEFQKKEFLTTKVRMSLFQYIIYPFRNFRLSLCAERMGTRFLYLIS
jgi:hypothetical protein